MRRLAPLLLLVAAPSLDVGCFGDGPCEGECPAPWSVKFSANAPGGKGIDQGQPFVVDVTADGTHESISCNLQGPLDCSGTAGDFQVVRDAACNGGCGVGFVVVGTSTFPSKVDISVTNAGGQVGHASLSLSYASPTDACGCKSAGAQPDQSL